MNSENQGTRKNHIITAVIAIVACVAVAVVCIFGFGLFGTKRAETQTIAENKSAAKTVTSYAEVYQLLSASRDSGGKNSAMTDNIVMETAVDEAVAAPMAAPSASEAPAALKDTGSGSADYSGTNVQVEGVDEADIIKTDGSYIYHLVNGENGYKLIISSAKGADTAVLSETLVADGSNGYAAELFVSGERVAVITQHYDYSEAPDADAENYMFGNNTTTNIVIYDVSDRAKPTVVNTLGQSGSYISSRFIDGIIYIVSNQYVYGAINEAQVKTYVPCIVTDGKVATIPADSISIFQETSEPSYVIASSVELESGSEYGSVKAVFGSGGTIYATAEYLLVAGFDYGCDESGELTNGEGKHYQTFNYTTNTNLVLFELANGSLTEKASGTVKGALVNQFAMDYHKGSFRIVTTVDESKQTVYTDGIDTYEYDNSRSNALYILDDTLSQVGCIEGVAPDEQVYSVRFDGDMCYFVTFRQVDPLFSVDVSDPANPYITGELKLPGYSSYLHLWSGTRLLGLGYDADEETGRRESLKLSMFDVEDYVNMKELASEQLAYDYSPATYDHKQLLISAERDIIGFSTGESYVIYGYSDENGFYIRAELTSGGEGEEWYGNLRGLFIGDDMYICGQTGIAVYSISNSFDEITTIAY